MMQSGSPTCPNTTRDSYARFSRLPPFFVLSRAIPAKDLTRLRIVVWWVPQQWDQRLQLQGPHTFKCSVRTSAQDHSPSLLLLPSYKSQQTTAFLFLSLSLFLSPHFSTIFINHLSSPFERPKRKILLDSSILHRFVLQRRRRRQRQWPRWIS